MCNGQDLLPESVNVILDNVEASLCLPILLLMILCTAQFIVNHALGIGCSVYQSIQERQESGMKCPFEVQTGTGLLDKLKGMFGTNFGGTVTGYTGTGETSDANSQEEDWDYCYNETES